MKKVALAEVKDHFSEYLDEAAKQDIVITRHGRPAGVLVGFESEDDWFDYRLANDPRFLKRIAQARATMRAGAGIRWAEVMAEEDRRSQGCEVVSDRPRSRSVSKRTR